MNDQPVVCRLDSFRQFCRQFFVAWKPVGEVGEPGVLCADPFRNLQCSLQCKVGYMVSSAYGIYYEMINSTPKGDSDYNEYDYYDDDDYRYCETVDYR